MNSLNADNQDRKKNRIKGQSDVRTGLLGQAKRIIRSDIRTGGKRKPGELGMEGGVGQSRTTIASGFVVS